jgi:hypothetical protein
LQTAHGGVVVIQRKSSGGNGIAYLKDANQTFGENLFEEHLQPNLLRLMVIYIKIPGEGPSSARH